MQTARASLALVITATLLVAGSSTASPRTDAQAPPRGSILFKGGPGGVDLRPRIYAVDAGGARLKEVLADAYDARWSPDGRRLAFLRFTRSAAPAFGLAADLYVMQADGTGVKRVTGLIQPYSGAGGNLSWSPDGRRIAYRELAGRDEVISAVAVNGGRKVRLAKGRQPTWSPNGRLIAFTRQARLYVMNADGTRERVIADRAGLLSPQAWSPDGKSIAFSRCCLRGFAVAELESGRIRTFLDGRVILPSWSPNGRWIALTGSGTFLVRPDGRGLRRISALGEAPYFAAWSADSRAVAIADRCCSPDLWVLPIGGRQYRLTEGWRYGYGNYEPQWQPGALPTSRLAGREVERSNPTDSVVDEAVLRTTQPVRGLVADGSRVAVRYDLGSCRRSEVWEPAARSLVRFRSCARPGFAGDRMAWVTGPASGGGLDTWSMATATLDVPRAGSVSSVWCCTRPLSDPVGDGPLIVFSSWGPCRVSLDPPCAREPKTNGELYRLDGDRATRIASSSGPLTPLSVDGGRILVDHEDGTLGLVGSDGSSLRTFTLGTALVRAARHQGNDLVVQTPSAVEVIDIGTGLVVRAWPVPSDDARLVDVQDGVAVLVAGAKVHLLRLSDGRDGLIEAPGSGPALAQLEPSGLFYSYQVEDPGHPGRVSFVPFGQVPLR